MAVTSGFLTVLLPPVPTSSHLVQKAGNCSVPSSYWAFRSCGIPWIPSNILCFCHETASRLKSSETRRVLHHHRYVLVCALSGNGHLCTDEDIHLLREGEAILIMPFQFHSFLRFFSEKICWFFITFETDEDAKLEGFRGVGPKKLANEGMSILEAFIDAWLGKRQRNGLPLQLSLLVSYLMEGAEGTAESDRRSSGLSAVPHEDDELLRQINAYAKAHRDQHFSIADLGAALGVSSSLLRLRFQKATGLTLGKHLRELHIQHACSLLYRKDVRIAEVAQTCGFDSESSFSRAFKNARGMSPKDYRDSAAKR